MEIFKKNQRKVLVTIACNNQTTRKSSHVLTAAYEV